MKLLKQLILIILFTLLLFSCTSSDQNAALGPEPSIEENTATNTPAPAATATVCPRPAVLVAARAGALP